MNTEPTPKHDLHDCHNDQTWSKPIYPAAWMFKSPLGFVKLQTFRPALDFPEEHNWFPLYRKDDLGHGA